MEEPKIGEAASTRFAVGLLNSHGFSASQATSAGPSASQASTFAPPNPFAVPTQDTLEKLERMQYLLNKKLGPEMLSSRSGGGGAQLTYIEAWRVISLANDVFGFSGWTSEIKQLDVDFIDHDPATGKYSIGVSALVRISLRDGCFREDIGYGKSDGMKHKGEAIDKSKKEAVTDALKRAFRTFGNLLGNCLYDKSFISEVKKVKAPKPKQDLSDMHRGGSVFDPQQPAQPRTAPPPAPANDNRPIASTSKPDMPPPAARPAPPQSNSRPAPPPPHAIRQSTPAARGAHTPNRGRGGAPAPSTRPQPPPPRPVPAPAAAAPGDEDDGMFDDFDMSLGDLDAAMAGAETDLSLGGISTDASMSVSDSSFAAARPQSALPATPQRATTPQIQAQNRPGQVRPPQQPVLAQQRASPNASRGPSNVIKSPATAFSTAGSLKRGAAAMYVHDLPAADAAGSLNLRPCHDPTRPIRRTERQSQRMRPANDFACKSAQRRPLSRFDVHRSSTQTAGDR